MAQFLKHDSCPKCGSKDNLARYVGGSAYCFGCHYYEGTKISPYVLEEEDKHERMKQLPDDCSHEYSEQVLQWIGKYGLSIEELIAHNVLYSRSWEQLIFSFYDGDKRVVLWQARNFRPELAKKRKYFTQGNPADVLPIYRSNSNQRSVVLVEDCVSAMKISRLMDAMPVLGSTTSRQKLSQLRLLYDTVYFWLDGNMYDNAQKLHKQAQMLGFTSCVIWTNADPKDNSMSEIETHLKTS